MFNSTFGQQAGTTSFGGFGQPQPPAQNTGMFGQPTQTNTSVGFGTPATGSAFGTPLGNTAQPQMGQVQLGQPQLAQPSLGQPQDQGTGAVPFTAPEENDPVKAGKIDRYETITMMPAYSNFSLQELRFQDYKANRKGPTGPTPGFGFGQPQSSGSAFGQAPQSSPFGTSAFGAAPVNSGGSLFGQNNTANTSPFGSSNQGTSAFGNTNSGSSLFGQNNNQQSNGLFGGANTGFGSTPNSSGFSFGGANNTNNASTGQGSSLFGQAGANSSSTPFGAKPGGAFGQPAAPSGSMGLGFGAQSQPQNNAFGSTNNNSGNSLFGQGNTGGLFGQNKAPSAFGSANNSSGGIFGQNNNAAGAATNSFFGQTNNNNNNTTGGTGFGFGQNKPTSGGLFGQSNQPNNGGLFGQNTTQQNSSPFGQNNSMSNTFGQPQQPQQTGFGLGQNKPSTSLFGQPSGGASTFGQPNNAGTGAFGSAPTAGGLFGQNNQQQQQNNQKPGGFGFGTSAPSSTLGGGGGGLFGQQQQQPKPFGTPNTGTTPNTTSTFGSTLNKPAGSSLFGQSGNTNSSLGTGSGLFGSNNANTGGLSFGNNNNTAANSNTGSNGAGGLFGSNSTNMFANNGGNTSNSSGGLFGSKPPAGGTGLFGSSTAAPTTGGGLFGNTGTGAAPNSSFSSISGNQQSQANTGGLFGAKPATGGLFGSKPSTGVFGSQNAQPASAPLQPAQAPMASIDSDAYLSNPLFSNVKQTANSAINGDQPYAVSKKDAASFKPPTGILIAQIMQPTSLPKGRRITESSLTTTEKAAEKDREVDIKISSTQNSHGDLEKFRNVLFSNSTDDIILNTDAFNFAQNGVKGIGLGAERRNPQAVSVSTPTKKTQESTSAGDNDEDFVLVSPSLSQVDESAADGSGLGGPHGPTNGEEDLASDENYGLVVEPDTPDNEVVDSHGYWISPAKHKLTSMTLREVRQIKDFRVGQRTQGFVEFLEPVDLSMFSDVQAQVCGHIVVFGDRSFCLYPIESERPPVGQGFNKKHRVTLYNIFARRKDTREPVKDPEHPLAQKFKKRLQSQGKFVSWSAQTGTWTFEVDPASK